MYKVTYMNHGERWNVHVRAPTARAARCVFRASWGVYPILSMWRVK